CPAGLYGPNCAHECACQNGAECNAKDGSCVCPPGFYGASCSEVCPAGRYGTDCMKLCDCQNGAMCSPIDGKCECRAGWTGANCEKPCEAGYHGKDCGQRCDCADGMHCDPSDGESVIDHVPTDAMEMNVDLSAIVPLQMTRPFTIRSSLDAIMSQETAVVSRDGQVQTVEHLAHQEGKWGSGCNSECQCSNGATCDRLTGFCDCPAGFMGKNCETGAILH
ncbi:unnamed protein product, partial [Nippostrongylus brasiliensis]|uniref:MIP14095p (inferred by orthology to a D. melanogaster protein) n=1 Tax=Nippostrongylus brasiliensis TaxID=27835 RepID=A0A0N4YYF3_NIPBR